MLKTPKFLWALILLIPMVSINAYGTFPDDENDDYIPEQTARVARIKFLEGDAQIKRSDQEKWERATLNLPVVEGDEITTGENTKLELQFDKNNHLRLAGNSYLKIVNLQDEGIAVSLSQGSLHLTILEFDKDKGYFEIDAPKTTVAVQKKGSYRIDAGDETNKEVRVVVSKWGQARVYSDDSGFFLKNGRSAKLSLEGEYAGEWETSRSSRWGDDFDKWTAERDAIIERNLRNSYNQRYYGNNIYGADDLNDYGEWVYSRGYGHVWRPYNSSISRYANWSPYRYGHWRWLTYYGWTWVNDEPWGWATYHHGRWIHTNGYWVWSPYSNARRSRSFWRPAIVFITYIGSNFYWYPLPYDYGYYDYNHRYRQRWHRNRHGNGRNNNPRNNTPTRTVIPAENIARANRNRTPPLGRVPRTGVVSVPASEFGRERKGYRRPPLSVAEAVLKQKPVINNSPPFIPSFPDLNGKISKEILIPENRTVSNRKVKTGAGERKAGKPLDEKLRRKTIYGNRIPQTRTTKTVSNGGGNSAETKRRSTGVFVRTKRTLPRKETKRIETKRVPRSSFPQTTTKRSAPTRRVEPDRTSKPTQNNTRTERKSSPPVSRPQPRRSQPRSSPQPQPRRTQPKRSSPPPTRRSSPPTKRSQPKRESKPKSSPSKSPSKSKDTKN